MALAHVNATQGTAATSGTTCSATRTGATAGNLLLFCIRTYGGQTTSSVACTGESPVLFGTAYGNGTANASARLQWGYIASVSGTGNKTITATISGTITTAATMTVMEISGHDTGDPVGASVTTSGTGTTATTSLTTEVANSAIYGALMAVQSGLTPGAGYTTLSFASYWSYEYGEYDIDAGAVGSKTIDWSATSTDWSIVALEIKPAGGGGGSPPALMGQAIF